MENVERVLDGFLTVDWWSSPSCVMTLKPKCIWMSDHCRVFTGKLSWHLAFFSFPIPEIQVSILYGTVPVRTPYKAIACVVLYWPSVWTGNGTVRNVYVCQIVLLDVSYDLDRHSGRMEFMQFDSLWSYLETSRHLSLFWLSRVIESITCVYIVWYKV